MNIKGETWVCNLVYSKPSMLFDTEGLGHIPPPPPVWNEYIPLIGTCLPHPFPLVWRHAPSPSHNFGDMPHPLPHGLGTCPAHVPLVWRHAPPTSPWFGDNISFPLPLLKKPFTNIHACCNRSSNCIVDLSMDSFYLCNFNEDGFTQLLPWSQQVLYWPNYSPVYTTLIEVYRYSVDLHA